MSQAPRYKSLMRQTLTFFLPGSAIAAFAAALDPFAESLNAFEEDEAAARWSLRAVLREDAQIPDITAALSIAGAAAGVTVDPVYAPLEERDWLEASRSFFPPFRQGRFLIHGSHHAPAPGAAGLRLKLDAATAFGSGEHPTTQGCLAALETIAKRKRVSRVLDMGCGSGILAIAAARLWPSARALGIDNDPEAVRVARYNARRNRVPVRFVIGDGYAAPTLRRGPLFDVIVANILARPLQDMALELARHLRPGGTAILSGLLQTQQRGVLAAHTAHGLKLSHRFPISEWQTLVLEK
jgi:ribosomal protein L11 methyltransferase